jgi:hypothetical protein
MADKKLTKPMINVIFYSKCYSLNQKDMSLVKNCNAFYKDTLSSDLYTKMKLAYPSYSEFYTAWQILYQNVNFLGHLHTAFILNKKEHYSSPEYTILKENTELAVPLIQKTDFNKLKSEFSPIYKKLLMELENNYDLFVKITDKVNDCYTKSQVMASKSDTSINSDILLEGKIKENKLLMLRIEELEKKQIIMKESQSILESNNAKLTDIVREAQASRDSFIADSKDRMEEQKKLHADFEAKRVIEVNKIREDLEKVKERANERLDDANIAISYEHTKVRELSEELEKQKQDNILLLNSTKERERILTQLEINKKELEEEKKLYQNEQKSKSLEKEKRKKEKYVKNKREEDLKKKELTSQTKIEEKRRSDELLEIEKTKQRNTELLSSEAKLGEQARIQTAELNTKSDKIITLNKYIANKTDELEISIKVQKVLKHDIELLTLEARNFKTKEAELNLSIEKLEKDLQKQGTIITELENKITEGTDQFEEYKSSVKQSKEAEYLRFIESEKTKVDLLEKEQSLKKARRNEKTRLFEEQLKIKADKKQKKEIERKNHNLDHSTERQNFLTEISELKGLIGDLEIKSREDDSTIKSLIADQHNYQDEISDIKSDIKRLEHEKQINSEEIEQNKATKLQEKERKKAEREDAKKRNEEIEKEKKKQIEIEEEKRKERMDKIKEEKSDLFFEDSINTLINYDFADDIFQLIATSKMVGGEIIYLEDLKKKLNYAQMNTSSVLFFINLSKALKKFMIETVTEEKESVRSELRSDMRLDIDSIIRIINNVSFSKLNLSSEKMFQYVPPSGLPDSSSLVHLLYAPLEFSINRLCSSMITSLSIQTNLSEDQLIKKSEMHIPSLEDFKLLINSSNNLSFVVKEPSNVLSETYTNELLKLNQILKNSEVTTVLNNLDNENVNLTTKLITSKADYNNLKTAYEELRERLHISQTDQSNMAQSISAVQKKYTGTETKIDIFIENNTKLKRTHVPEKGIAELLVKPSNKEKFSVGIEKACKIINFRPNANIIDLSVFLNKCSYANYDNAFGLSGLSQNRLKGRLNNINIRPESDVRKVMQKLEVCFNVAHY